GKTTLARAIAPALGASPGAVVLRSDEFRKRLAGLRPTERAPPSAYGPEMTGRVYAALFAEAADLVAAGRSVILDATFLEAGRRAQAEALAARLDLSLEGLWLEAPESVLRDRLAGREGDASDATPDTLAVQLERDVGPVAWTRLQPHPDLTGQALARLGIPPGDRT
ncbi:MAG: AAA family ATPase, partial [Phenylobacterium sp.]